VQAVGFFFGLLGLSFGATNVSFWFITSNGISTAGLDTFASSVMYTTFLSTNLTQHFLFKDLNYPEKALVVSRFIVTSFQAFIYAYTSVLNFLAAMAVYDITNTAYKFVCSHTDMNVRSLLDIFDQMCTEVNKINAVNSRVMLVVYVQVLSWFTFSCLDVMEGSDWLLEVYLFSAYLLYALTFIVAAEANVKVSL